MATLNHLQRDALQTPNSRFAYLAPFYKQAKAVAWDIIKFYSKVVPGVKYNEAELRVDYPNGSRISLFGADNPDALRGLALWGVIFDEYSQQPSNIFSEIIRPALADNSGYAIWIGTPKGKNDFYRIFEQHKNDDEWLTMLLPASQSGILSQQELESAKKQMSIDEYNQEFECDFVAAIKGAYYAAQLQDLRQKKQITMVPCQLEFPVSTYWDLGISDTTCIIFVQTIGREIHIIDFYEANGFSLEHYAKLLNTKPYIYNTHYLPHDAEARELGTGRSRKEILEQWLGRDKIKIVPNLGIKDGIEAVRMLLPRCWFDEQKTSRLLDALGSYTQEWNIRLGIFNDKPLHNEASHASDAMRYCAVAYNEDLEQTKSHPVGMNKYKNFTSNFRPRVLWKA